MKVNLPGVPEGYKKYVQTVKNAESSAAKAQGDVHGIGVAVANTDKVTISGDAAARAELDRLAAEMSDDVFEAGGSDKLAALQEKVAQGSYYVPTDALADAILGRGR